MVVELRHFAAMEGMLNAHHQRAVLGRARWLSYSYDGLCSKILDRLLRESTADSI